MLQALFLIAAQTSNPTTVNGQELGSADRFKTRGPARVCIENAAVDLLKGETAYLQYAGIHRGVLRIEVGGEHWLITHGDGGSENGRRKLLYAVGGTSVYRGRSEGDLAYVFFAPTDYSDGEPVPVLTVSGSTMHGGGWDRNRLKRVSIFPGAPPGCLRRYAYGWDMLFGDEPVSQEQKKP